MTGSIFKHFIVFVLKRLLLDSSHFTSRQELIWNIDIFTPKIFANVLSQAIQGRGRIETSVKMIVNQEMNRTKVWQLKSIDTMSEIFLCKELYCSVSSQITAKPVPLIIMTNEQADVSIACFITRAAEYNPSEWTTGRRSEA
jgi:hypothetical protein